jgi:Spy/CpxP family protein refolding chaperone
MRRIKTAICSLMLVAAASSPAIAQGAGGAGGGRMGGRQMDPAQMAQRSSDRLLTGITLSATQSDSVKAIDARYAADMKTAMGGSDMRAKMTEMRDKQRKDIRAVLTADQQKVFDKNVEGMSRGRGGRGGGGGGGL